MCYANCQYSDNVKKRGKGVKMGQMPKKNVKSGSVKEKQP